MSFAGGEEVTFQDILAAASRTISGRHVCRDWAFLRAARRNKQDDRRQVGKQIGNNMKSIINDTRHAVSSISKLSKPCLSCICCGFCVLAQAAPLKKGWTSIASHLLRSLTPPETSLPALRARRTSCASCVPRGVGRHRRPRRGRPGGASAAIGRHSGGRRRRRCGPRWMRWIRIDKGGPWMVKFTTGTARWQQAVRRWGRIESSSFKRRWWHWWWLWSILQLPVQGVSPYVKCRM